MSELDFDELDKAVAQFNKNMTNEVEATVPPAGVSSQVPQPQPQPQQSSPTAVTQPASTQQAPASRRQGRVMDVLHPSQPQMRGLAARRVVSGVSTGGRTAPAAVQSEAPTPTEAPQQTTSAPTGTPVEGQGVDAAPAQPQVAVANATPQPASDTEHALTEHSASPAFGGALESSHQEVSPEDTQSTQVMTTETQADAPAPDTQTQDTTQNVMQQSPFLADAKVEKRPLGGTTEESSQLTGKATETQATSDAADTGLDALHQDVLMLDAEPSTGTVKADDAATNQDSAAIVEKTETLTTPNPEKAPGLPSTEEKVAGVASGKKQDKARPGEAAVTESSHSMTSSPAPTPAPVSSTPTDQHVTDIYETDGAHAADTAPQKKSHIMTWVVTIISSAAVGVLGGGALYYLLNTM